MAVLISENDVLARWPALSKSALLAARKSGRIGWVRGKRGSAWYREEAIEAFITKELEQPCHDQEHDRFSNLADNGSPRTPVRPSYTASGLSQALEEHVA